MTTELTTQVTVGLLLLWLSTVVAVGILLSLAIVGFVKRNRSRSGREDEAKTELNSGPHPMFFSTGFEQYGRWMAVKTGNPSAVQSALRLHNPTPCSWGEGMADFADHNLFISPPVQGWVLVMGPGLPDPADEIDECYKFLLNLSRKLGQVQFFSSNRAVNHHAWVWVDGKEVVRAYAWAERTLWNQGKLTQAEKDLGMKCFDYHEEPEPLFSGAGDQHYANAEKVNFLSARWSVDPTTIDESTVPAEQGIAGNLNQ